MADDGFGRLRTVVFVAPDKLRSGIVMALEAIGFKDVAEAGSVADFIERVKLNDIDLIITLSRVEDTAAGDAIRDLRLGRLETSPFPVVLALLQTAEKEQVIATLNSGVDDVLLFPVSADALVKRIKQFTQDRRPFVVTHDYIGPDRRLNPRPDQPGGLLIKVPNPVRSRTVGVADAEIQRGIEGAILVIDRDKLKLNGLLLLRLLFEFRGDAEIPPSGTLTASAFLTACIKSCDDSARRARRSSERAVREKATATAEILRGLLDTADLANDSRFPELIGSLQDLVDEISTYHGSEIKL